MDEHKELVSSIRNVNKEQISSILQQSIVQNAPSNDTIANPEAIKLDYLSSEDGGLQSSDINMSDSDSDSDF
ncbi:hypothetical protein BB560_000537 [Smittium megazygosporum]|uniref:Uncharacterized protein n=1 Tax=Smittium megazygosporum TaxID=133381 RepID=A0A2T9ZK47_9FUNG|nr:hypothetical protein BB560_000537 [Smittium megazygosporum]